MIRTIASFIAIALLGSCGARDGAAAGPATARIGDGPAPTGQPLRGVGLESTPLVSIRTDRARLRGEPVERIALIDDQMVLADRPLADQTVTGLELIGTLSDDREITLVVVAAQAADRHRYRLLARDAFGNFTSVCGGTGFGSFARAGDGVRFHCPADS